VVGTIPHGAVAITFDDGYADNLSNGRPRLEQFEIPAMLFPLIGNLGAAREFWWDEVERVVLDSTTLPSKLRLTINGTALDWEATKDQPSPNGTAEPANDSGDTHNARQAREELCLALHQALRPLRADAQQRVLDSLVAWAGVAAQARPTHRTMTPDELLRMADGNLVEIGAHTVSHPVLATLSPLEQREEILQSKLRLEHVLNRPVTCFAYPFGQEADYTAETVEIVGHVGFSAACTTVGGSVTRHVHPLRLPRLVVRDWDGVMFARQLHESLHG
ncbi:MAG: polysaccharide deacetylase family protein, partial [Acidimicrobiia bacterium]